MKLIITTSGLAFLFAALLQLVYVAAMLVTHPYFNLPQDWLWEDLTFISFLAIPFCAGFAVAKTKIERETHA